MKICQLNDFSNRPWWNKGPKPDFNRTFLCNFWQILKIAFEWRFFLATFFLATCPRRQHGYGNLEMMFLHKARVRNLHGWLFGWFDRKSQFSCKISTFWSKISWFKIKWDKCNTWICKCASHSLYVTGVQFVRLSEYILQSKLLVSKNMNETSSNVFQNTRSWLIV